MNDVTTPWIDPELVAAGQLLQQKGLVAPDRTVASIPEVRAATDRIGAFLGEASVPLRQERDLSLPVPHGRSPAGFASSARRFSFTRMAAASCGQHPELIISCAIWCASGVAALSVDTSCHLRSFPVAFDDGRDDAPGGARGPALGSTDPARVGGDSAGANLALAAALAMRDAGERALRQLLIYGCFDRLRQPVLAAFRPGRWVEPGHYALDLGDLSRTARAKQDYSAAPMLGDLKGSRRRI